MGQEHDRDDEGDVCKKDYAHPLKHRDANDLQAEFVLEQEQDTGNGGQNARDGKIESN
jgi:hypothetical protein